MVSRRFQKHGDQSRQLGDREGGMKKRHPQAPPLPSLLAICSPSQLPHERKDLLGPHTGDTSLLHGGCRYV